MKFGTIGTGSIVDFFIESSKHVQNVSCDFVYSRSLDKASEFAKKHGVKNYTDSLEVLFANDCIDTIYIASPNTLHYSQAKRALKAKKNVILEKPVCAKVEQYMELLSLAKENEVYIVEAIVNTHCETMKFVKENLDKLGNIKCVSSNFSQYSSRYDNYKNGIVTNVFNLEMEGGALVDIGVYNLYACVHLFNIPKNYQYYPNIGYNGVDTSGCLILQYDDFFASLINAKDCYAPNTFTIQGENATIIIDEGSVGGCKHASLVVKGDIVDEFRQDDLNMIYEIQDFQKAFDTNDVDLINKWNEESITVLSLLENSRLKAGIYYPCDNT